MQYPQGFEQLHISHIGFVVDDIPEAVRVWSNVFGAGPFYHFPNPRFEELCFRGEPVDFNLEAAFGHFGGVRVELTKYTFPTPIPELAELLGTNHNAYNHTAFLAEETRAASKRLEEMGYPMFLSGRAGDDNWFWHDARHDLGHCIEIHTKNAMFTGFDSAVDSSATGWDGSEPLRADPPAEFAEQLAKYL